MQKVSSTAFHIHNITAHQESVIHPVGSSGPNCVQTSTLISFRDESKHEETQHNFKSMSSSDGSRGYDFEEAYTWGGGRGGRYHGNQPPRFAQDEGVQGVG